MTDKDLVELKNYWVKILSIEDWEVLIRFKRAEKMFLEDVQGECRFNFISRQAIVNIIDPLDWIDIEFNQDFEKTVVHELLHIKFSEAFDEDYNEDIFKDRLIHRLLNDLAKSLVLAKKGGKL